MLSKYEVLIPKLTNEPVERRDDDCSDKYLTPSEDPKLEIDPLVFIEWYCKRILSSKYFGFIQDILQLCKHAHEIENFEEFSFYTKFSISNIYETSFQMKI